MSPGVSDRPSGRSGPAAQAGASLKARTRLPTAELDALCERARQFIDDCVIPREDYEHAHDVAFNDRLISELRLEAGRRGLLSPHLPRELGGLGLCWQDSARVFEQAGRSFIGAASMGCGAPDQPNIDTLLQVANDGQRARWLMPLVRGEIRSAFAMTEPAPGVGSDPRMIRTTARRDGDGWVIDGHKWFSSGVVGAAFAIVVARADEGVSWFLVPTDTPGYRFVRDVRSIDPFSTGGHGELRFEGCRVGPEALIGEPGRGLEYAQLRLEGARLFHCMRNIGLVSRGLQIAQQYVMQRESFGARLAEHQQVQAMVADSHMDLYASRLMTADVARRLDEGESIRHHSSMVKVFVSEALYRVADRAAQMTGAVGMAEDGPISLIFRRMRPFRIFDGASEVHRSAIARRVFQHRLEP